MKLQHTHTKQKNFIAAPIKAVETIINRPIKLQHQKTTHQTLGASGILITKIEHNGRF